MAAFADAWGKAEAAALGAKAAFLDSSLAAGAAYLAARVAAHPGTPGVVARLLGKPAPRGSFRDGDGRLRSANGTFAPDGGRKRATGRGTHGSTAGAQPATLYARYDADGQLLKWGVSQQPDARYSDAELAGGFLREVADGTRREMLDFERALAETNPGPLNREPWAGSRVGED